MIHKQLISACALFAARIGWLRFGRRQCSCITNARPEQPPANLPVQLHQRNWTGFSWSRELRSRLAREPSALAQ